MKIDAIDVYWMKLPLAFVWRTSYADQHVTDTILVRMEGSRPRTSTRTTSASPRSC